MAQLLSATLEPNTDEWRLQRIREIAADYWEYRKRNQKIKDKDGNIIPFEPNSVQRKLATTVIEMLEAGVPVRLIILKARQMGISTEIESIISWYTSTHKNISATITAHLDEAASNIYAMFRRFYEHSLPMFQPALKYNTKSDLTFAKLGSQIKTASAESKGTGRSSTNQILHNSEVAFWPDGQALVAGLMQTVPMRPNTMVFHESTANGIGGYFYDTWQKAKKGDSVFRPIFFAWFEMEEYSLPAPDGFTPTQMEREMQELYELTNDQLFWYRTKLMEFNGDLDTMRQEYPSNDMEAFIASGRPRFDIKKLLAMEKLCVAGDFGTLTKVEGKYEFIKAERAELQIWKYPERIGQYTLGGDVAEGLEHGDFSVIDIMDRRTLETVARWRGHCDPDVLGQIAYDLGTWYNAALVGIEANNHGLTTIQKLKDLGYTNMYRREGNLDKDLYEVPGVQLGFKTTVQTKPLVVDKLAMAIREGSIVDYDITFVREAMTYVVDANGRTNAQEGCFDDCVMAKAINLHMFEWSFTSPSIEELSIHIPENMLAAKNRYRP